MSKLQKPNPNQLNTLLEGFWPTLDWRKFHRRTWIDRVVGNIDITPKDEEEASYCSHVKDKPELAFNPWHNILVGDFVLVNRIIKIEPMWLGKVLTTVARRTMSPLYGQFKAQWWEPLG